MIATAVLLGLVLLCLIIFRKCGFWKTRDNSTSPPQVRGSLPLVGHLLYLGQQPEKVLMKWARKYGKMFLVDFGPLKTLVIDDAILMRDLLNQPAFSGRMQNEVFSHMSHNFHGIVFSEEARWESLRRFTLKHLRDFGFRKQHMETLLSNEVKELLSSFKLQTTQDKPFLIHHNFVLPVLNALWVLSAGEKTPQQDTRLEKLHSEHMAAFNRLTTTGVMFAPKLRHIAPSLLGWTRYVNASRAIVKFIEEIIAEHIETYDDNNKRDLIDSYIAEIRQTTDVDSPFYKETGYINLHAVVGDILTAGSETTSTTLKWAVLYLAAHPEVQEKLHQEIISVLGTTESPKLSDRPNLPYTEATICEVLRLSSFLPLGVMHRALQDTTYDGFTIEKGTLIMANMYSAHYNPNNWKEPEQFRPERFLSPTGEKLRNPPHLVPFQAGRRQCLGENFAMDALFLFVTSIFQNFQISPYDINEKLELEPPPGFMRAPKPFSVKISSRF